MQSKTKRTTIEYEGKTYIKARDKWTDASHFVVPETLQRKLNNIYSNAIDFLDLTYQQLVEDADGFKESSSYALAIKYYEEALKKAAKDDVRYILPRITSCYRKNKQPQKVIELFSEVKNKYGAEFFSVPLLTSAAAAYCDMHKYIEAKKCCDRAYAMSGGKGSGELSAVYGRLKKEANL